jgi:hypothetical protein
MTDSKIFHMFITRFMIASNEWLTNGRTKESVLNKDNILMRLKNVEKYYVPWVTNQTNKNFHVFILVDQDLDVELIHEIRSIFPLKNVYIMKNDVSRGRSYNFFLEKKYITANSDYNDFSELQKIIGDGVSNCKKLDHLGYDYIVTTRIDDDDVLPNNFVDFIQSRTKLITDGQTIIYGFESGYILENDKLTKYTSPPDQCTSSMGISLLQKCNDNIDEYFNVYFTIHTNWDSGTKVILNGPYLKVKDPSKMVHFIDKINPYYIYNRNISHSAFKYPDVPMTQEDIDFVANNFSLDL